MKMTDTSSAPWQVVDVPLIAAGKSSVRLHHFSHVVGVDINAPTLAAGFIHRDVRTTRTRLFVAQGISLQRKIDSPEGYTSPAHYATDRAAELLSLGKNIPGQIRTLARELHPRNTAGNFPQVALGAVMARVADGRSLEIEVHKAGATKIFYRTTDDRWHEILPGSSLSDKGRKRIRDVNEEYQPRLKAIAKEYGLQSRTYRELRNELLTKQAAVLRSFSCWDCPPLGLFEGGSRLHKVKNDFAVNVDAVVVASHDSKVSVKGLYSLSDPRDITPETFRGDRPSAIAALVREL